MDVDGTPGGDELARRVAANVERLRLDANMTVSQVIEESGLSRSGYYARLRNETSWTLEDVARFAAIFAVDPSELTIVHGALQLDASDDALVSGSVVARRLSLLRNAREDAPSMTEVLTQLHEQGIDVPSELWEALTAGAGRLRVKRSVLSSLAAFFSVDPEFLTAPDTDPAADRAEAQLELRVALRESGGGRLGMRAIGDVSPSALRAIARSLRNVDHENGEPDA